MRNGLDRRLERLEAKGSPDMSDYALDWSSLSPFQLETLRGIAVPFDVKRSSDDELRALASLRVVPLEQGG